MAVKKLAVEGLTISHDTGSLASGGSFSVSSSPSTKVRETTPKAVYRGSLAFTWSGGTYSGQPASGSGSITPTSTKVKADGQAVVREGDTGTMSGTYTNPAPPPATLPFSGAPVKVSAAGQSTSFGE